MKKVLTILVMLSIIVLVGCVESDKSINETDEINDVLEDSQKEIKEIPDETIPSSDIEEVLPIEGKCQPRWRCISSDIKAFQNQDCNFTERRTCPLGCINDSCKVAETCKAGIKCINENKKGFRLESCRWINIENCEFGCEDAKCNPKSNVSEVEKTIKKVTSVVEPVVEAASSSWKSLTYGVVETIKKDGNEYNFSIYQLGDEGVQLRVNKERTDWLTEGGSYSYQSFTITIEEILFQAYEGGTKTVSYTVD